MRMIPMRFLLVLAASVAIAGCHRPDPGPLDLTPKEDLAERIVREHREKDLARQGGAVGEMTTTIKEASRPRPVDNE